MSQRTSSIALIDLGPDSVHPAAVSPFRRVGRQTLLERTVRRLSESSLLDEIVIIGGPQHASHIAQSATQPARWIVSSGATAVERAWQAAETCQAEWVVCVGPTAVFVDAILIDRLLASAWASPKATWLPSCRNRMVNSPYMAADWPATLVTAERYCN